MSWGGKLWTKENIIILSLMLKCIHGLNPHWLNYTILMACEIHDRNTCFANNMNVVIPEPNIETFRYLYMYQGAISWNSLPFHLQMLPPMIVLKECI